MAPLYRNFILTPGAGGWRYRHQELDIGGSCPSLIECVREIDELCEPRDLRLSWPILAWCACMAVVYAAIWWGW